MNFKTVPLKPRHQVDLHQAAGWTLCTTVSWLRTTDEKKVASATKKSYLGHCRWWRGRVSLGHCGRQGQRGLWRDHLVWVRRPGAGLLRQAHGGRWSPDPAVLRIRDLWRIPEHRVHHAQWVSRLRQWLSLLHMFVENRKLQRIYKLITGHWSVASNCGNMKHGHSN